MSQSLSRIYVHLVFSTKGRKPVLMDSIRAALHAYCIGVMNNLKCPVVEINSVEDHIHILFDLCRTVSISKAVQDVKASSSVWIKTKGTDYSQFAWQGGYAALSVGSQDFAAVREYIANQQEHHHRRTFQEELRTLLTTCGVDFDERYIWD